mmetsp:Transcript_71094/g.208375  ORF Transcript_71094/g.208375 Transcript_71094/m.208375 type:complete len:353 (+) Transcript_71094:168-1226(+)
MRRAGMLPVMTRGHCTLPAGNVPDVQRPPSPSEAAPSPEEAGRPRRRHELPGVEGLRLRDVHEGVHRVHQQRPLAQEGRPDVALGVEVRPDDPQLVEPREQRHHVCDGLALVGGLRLHSGVDCHELEDLVAGPHELAGPLLLVPPPLQQADRHLHVSRLPRDELHALLHQRGRIELASFGALLPKSLHGVRVGLKDGREAKVHREEAPRAQLDAVLRGEYALHTALASKTVLEHTGHRPEQRRQPPIVAHGRKPSEEEDHLGISMTRYGRALADGAALHDVVHAQEDGLRHQVHHLVEDLSRLGVEGPAADLVVQVQVLLALRRAWRHGLGRGGAGKAGRCVHRRLVELGLG